MDVTNELRRRCEPTHPRNKLRRGALFTCVLSVVLLPSVAVGEFDAGRAGFRLAVGKEICPYRVLAFSVLPGATLDIRTVSASSKRSSPGGESIPTPAAPSAPRPADDAVGLEQIAAGHWRWNAPQSTGLNSLVFHDDRGDTMRLNVFVLVPRSRQQGEALNGYRMGRYPNTPLKGLAIYKPPSGFVEVTPENQDTWVSPHFRLRQFLCKQSGGFPKYLVLRERLLLKLEAILEGVNAAGYACNTFHVMSGYRTPWYNRSIGNVKYSRHVWGGAADVFIDVDPADGMMDDLNDDGAVNWRDGKVLYDLIDAFYGKAWYEGYEGGLGRYKKTPSHGPFVHVDVRGFRARWGD